MKRMPIEKYRPYPPVAIPDRHWPDRAIGRDQHAVEALLLAADELLGDVSPDVLLQVDGVGDALLAWP